jgi:hypothetical protein
MDMTTPPRRLPLRWEAPPQPLTKAETFALEWADVTQVLKQRAGQWAVIVEGLSPNSASVLTSKIRRGDVEPFLNDGAGKFEASQYTDPQGRATGSAREVTIYARYAFFERD